MNSKRTDFLIRVGVALVAALAISPVVGVLLPATPFHRVMTRCFLIALVVSLAWRALNPRTWPAKMREMGVRGPHRGRRFWAGAATALVLLTILLIVSWLLGGRIPPSKPFHQSLLLHFLAAAGSGIGVGLFEEVFCRGYLKEVIGGPASAFLYASVHYFKPPHGSVPAGDAYDPLLAVKRFPELLGGFADVRNVTLGMLSLFLLGLTFNRLKDRTGSLFMGIGLHVGLVFGLSFFRRVLSDVPAGNAWIYGGGRLYDGVLGTLLIALLLLVSRRAPLPGELSRP